MATACDRPGAVRRTTSVSHHEPITGAASPTSAVGRVCHRRRQAVVHDRPRRPRLPAGAERLVGEGDAMSGRVYEFEGNTVAGADRGTEGREEDGVGKRGEALGELLGTGPLFQVVRRGYDRLAVDAYVESTEQELQKIRGKLHTVLRRFHAVSDALVEARQRPEDQAGDIVAQARAEADARMANVMALREAAGAARDEAR